MRPDVVRPEVLEAEALVDRVAHVRRLEDSQSGAARRAVAHRCQHHGAADAAATHLGHGGDVEDPEDLAFRHPERRSHRLALTANEEDPLCLVVADDGQGFPVGKAGRVDSYGMVGMRERADAIRAVLELESEKGRGTTVRCRLENP